MNRKLPDVGELLKQALAFHQQGLLNDAKRLYEEILKAIPDHFDALHLLGVIAFQTANNSEAARFISRSLQISPLNSTALLNYGNVLKELKRHEEALASYDKAIAIRAGYANALSNRGVVLKELKRHEEALASYDKAIAIRPDYADAHYNRGNVLQELKRHEEALASYDKAIAIKPDDVDTLTGRGNALKELKRHEEALASYDKAIAIKPDDADTLFNRGVVLQELKRHEEALASYDKAIAIKPDDAKVHLNESICRLLIGDFARGWSKFEWRWQDKQLKESRRSFPQPLWLGEQPVLGKTILLHEEQGVGDTLQFVRYIKDVAGLGATVLLAARTSLKPLLNDIDGVSQLICQGEPLPPFDYHCPLLSLPLAFKTEIDTIPSQVPYLQSNPKLLAQWQAKINNKHFPRVGIAWSGSHLHENDRNRSIPLGKMAPLASGNISLVSLQKEVRAEDQDVLDAHKEILHFGEELKDFGDTAALIDCLDLVISVDTSVAHLAGALGKPVWILLPYNPDWRWLLDREDSPWYPTARLFRQARMEDWDSVIQRVIQEMSSLFPLPHNLPHSSK